MTPQHCHECRIPLRVSGPCVHGGEWRCWSCHPLGKETLNMNPNARAKNWLVPRVWRKLTMPKGRRR